MKHLQPIAIIILLCIQVFLMVKINQRNETPMLEAAQSITEQNDSLIKQGQLIIAHIDAEIGSRVDTLKVINNYKTVLKESYNKDIAALVANDSSQRAQQYTADYSASFQLFKQGFYFTK